LTTIGWRRIARPLATLRRKETTARIIFGRAWTCDLLGWPRGAQLVEYAWRSRVHALRQAGRRACSPIESRPGSLRGSRSALTTRHTDTETTSCRFRNSAISPDYVPVAAEVVRSSSTGSRWTDVDHDSRGNGPYVQFSFGLKLVGP